MTLQPAAIAARIAASACLLLAGASGASAQINCALPNSAGPPVVHDTHIFCGDINGAGNAVGFHSRPGGVNPVLAPGGGAVIGGGAIAAVPGAPAGIYRLNNFTITTAAAGPVVKAFSTMFPDACNQAAVLAAIRNARAAGVLAGQQFTGPSGAGCQAGAPPAPFQITGYINGAGAITTAFPNY
jgi:Bacterial EndoU nuclease